MKRFLIALGTGIGLMGLFAGGAKSASITIGRGVLKNAAKRRKRRETRAIVYHTTSRSLPQRLVRNGHEPLSASFINAAVERYQYIAAENFAAALVAPDGSYVWLGHPDLALWHAATPDGAKPPPAWWRERWPDLDEPIDLTGRGAYINNVTVSVDVMPLPDADAVRFTDASLETAARIGRMLADRYGLTLERRHHLGHSDVDPWSRGNASGGWDPGWDWASFMNQINGGARAVA